MMSFSILNEKNLKPITATGTYVIGLFEVCEDYEQIIEAVKELQEEMKELKTIEVKNKVYKINHYLGGDMKFLLLSNGLMSANSNYPCLYCKYRAGTTSEANLDNEKCRWSMLNKKWRRTTKGAIKIILEETKNANNNETENSSKSSNKSIFDKNEKIFCQKHKPIFDHIPIKRIVIDILHLYLRICDRLMSLLFKQLQSFDESENLRKIQKKSFYVNRLINYFQKDLKISKPQYFDKITKKICLRDFRGGEYKKILTNINLVENLKNLRHVKKVQRLWNNFSDIIESVKLNDKEFQLQHKTLAWLQLFLQIYDNDSVTPYIHNFVYHLHEPKKVTW